LETSSLVNCLAIPSPVAIAAGLSLVVSLPVFSACPVETYGAAKSSVCTGEKCNFIAPPVEIAQISRGGYLEEIGLLSGGATWIGLDLKLGTLIEVQRYAGVRLWDAPRISSPTDDRYARETKTGRTHWIDIVRKRPATLDETSDFVCAANGLWTTNQRFLRNATDIHSALFLLDGDSIKNFGGLGLLSGDAEALQKLLISFRDRTWPTDERVPPLSLAFEGTQVKPSEHDLRKLADYLQQARCFGTDWEGRTVLSILSASKSTREPPVDRQILEARAEMVRSNAQSYGIKYVDIKIDPSGNRVSANMWQHVPEADQLIWVTFSCAPARQCEHLCRSE
jgi:hypothetical protein